MRKNPEYQQLYLFFSTFFVFLKNILLAIAITKKTVNAEKQSSVQNSFDTDFTYSKTT